MPKLVISKFNGTPQDWVRFWGQFEAQIDKSEAPAVTKFSYLMELVEVKVRKLIDGPHLLSLVITRRYHFLRNDMVNQVKW